MTKAIWIIGAVVVVGMGIAAGLILSGGSEPTAVAAESNKGSGSESQIMQAVVSDASASEPAQVATVADSVFGSESEVVAVLAGSEQAGAVAVASIDELFADAARYGNREVVVRGTIVTQCIAGCTFSLEDGTGVIGVELVDDALDNVLSGGSVGRQVEVRGTIESSPYLVIVVEEPDAWRYLD